MVDISMNMSWTIKKAEHWKIDAFELWCWRRLLKVPSAARRSNQSILKEISPEYSLEGLMLKLKFQYFRHLMQKDPDPGKDWRQVEKGMTEDEMAGWHHWLEGRESEWTLGVGNGQGGLACCLLFKGRKESDMTERLNWTELRYSSDKSGLCPQGVWKGSAKPLGTRTEGGFRILNHQLFSPAISLALNSLEKSVCRSGSSS